MELSLSLGDTPKKEKPFSQPTKIIGKELGFCMAVGGNVCANGEKTVRPPVQLDLLPFSPVHRTQQPSANFPWLKNNLVFESNRRVVDDKEGVAAAISTSPTSTASSFRQIDYSVFRRAIKGKTYFQAGLIIADHDSVNGSRPAPSKGISDEEFENGNNNNISRKKLRLTKEQSAFLEQSFKEHTTLNPKQKKVLAKQLNLRTRQVEVWFQNRRARTKLKKTEVDCEHLKRCCETLTQENRKLQKEIQELRALYKHNKQPFYMQRPPTTLTMCPSCQRVVTTTTANNNEPEPAKLLSLSSTGP